MKCFCSLSSDITDKENMLSKIIVLCAPSMDKGKYAMYMCVKHIQKSNMINQCHAYYVVARKDSNE